MVANRTTWRGKAIRHLSAAALTGVLFGVALFCLMWLMSFLIWAMETDPSTTQSPTLGDIARGVLLTVPLLLLGIASGWLASLLLFAPPYVAVSVLLRRIEDRWWRFLLYLPLGTLFSFIIINGLLFIAWHFKVDLVTEVSWAIFALLGLMTSAFYGIILELMDSILRLARAIRCRVRMYMNRSSIG